MQMMVDGFKSAKYASHSKELYASLSKESCVKGITGFFNKCCSKRKGADSCVSGTFRDIKVADYFDYRYCLDCTSVNVANDGCRVEVTKECSAKWTADGPA